MELTHTVHHDAKVEDYPGSGIDFNGKVVVRYTDGKAVSIVTMTQELWDEMGEEAALATTRPDAEEAIRELYAKQQAAA